jgi:hypothetical protein
MTRHAIRMFSTFLYDYLEVTNNAWNVRKIFLNRDQNWDGWLHGMAAQTVGTMHIEAEMHQQRPV